MATNLFSLSNGQLLRVVWGSKSQRSFLGRFARREVVWKVSLQFALSVYLRSRTSWGWARVAIVKPPTPVNEAEGLFNASSIKFTPLENEAGLSPVELRVKEIIEDGYSLQRAAADLRITEGRLRTVKQRAEKKLNRHITKGVYSDLTPT